MRISSLFLVVVGLGVAGGSVYLARDVITQQLTNSVAEQESATVGVLVAGRDISFGQAIEPHLVTTINWPREALPAGIITDPAFLLPSDGV